MTPPLCPKCNAPMKYREGKFGPFWGCTKYPDCKGLVNISVEAQQEILSRLDDNSKTWKERFFAERNFWIRKSPDIGPPIHQNGIPYERSECPCCGEKFKLKAQVEKAKTYINNSGIAQDPDIDKDLEDYPSFDKDEF